MELALSARRTQWHFSPLRKDAAGILSRVKGPALNKRKGFCRTSPHGFCLLSPSSNKQPSPRVGFNLLFLVWMCCRDDSFLRRVSGMCCLHM